MFIRKYKIDEVKEYLHERNVYIHKDIHNDKNIVISIKQSIEENNYIDISNKEPGDHILISVDSHIHRHPIVIRIDNDKKYDFSTTKPSDHIIINVENGKIEYRDFYTIWIR